jgi:hypothetical protein
LVAACCDGYKPFNIDELKARISTILKLISDQKKAAISHSIELLQDHLEKNLSVKRKNREWGHLEKVMEDYNITDREKEYIQEFLLVFLLNLNYYLCVPLSNLTAQVIRIGSSKNSDSHDINDRKTYNPCQTITKGKFKYIPGRQNPCCSAPQTSPDVIMLILVVGAGTRLFHPGLVMRQGKAGQ